jgi:hypothetical protein
MKLQPVDIDLGEIMASMTFEVSYRVTARWTTRFRLWLGLRLFRLTACVIGAQCLMTRIAKEDCD